MQGQTVTNISNKVDLRLDNQLLFGNVNKCWTRECAGNQAWGFFFLCCKCFSVKGYVPWSNPPLQKKTRILHHRLFGNDRDRLTGSRFLLTRNVKVWVERGLVASELFRAHGKMTARLCISRG